MTDVAMDYQLLTERINPLIERAELAIARLGLGVAAGIPMSDGFQLQFGKICGTWRLHITNFRETPFAREPLVTKSRVVRLRGLELLPALVVALRESAELQLVEATRIVAAAESYLGELERRS